MLSTVLLFVLLSPGFILTLPPGNKGVFFSCQTSLLAILVHAVVFGLIVMFRRKIPVLRSVLKSIDTIF
jgi:hypothetical protein